MDRLYHLFKIAISQHGYTCDACLVRYRGGGAYYYRIENSEITKLCPECHSTVYISGLNPAGDHGSVPGSSSKTV